MRVRDRMALDVFTASDKATLNEIWDLMEALGVRHMPIIDGERLIGVISDRDVYLRALYCNGSMVVPSVPVKEVMSKPVVTCEMGNAICDVAEVMLERKIDCLPVMDGERLVGMVTSSDLLDILCSMMVDTQRQAIPLNFHLKSCALPVRKAIPTL